MPSFITIDLDEAPAKRFVPVVKARDKELRTFAATWDTSLREQFGSWAVHMYTVLRPLLKLIPLSEEHHQELKGIAHHTGTYGLTYDKLVLLNVAVDLLSTCTSAVMTLSDKAETTVHMRNLDWELSAISPLLVPLEFTKNNEVVFRCLTFAGCIGTLTGVRPNAFAISYNYRKALDRPNLLTRGWRMLSSMSEHRWASLAIRESLTVCESFETAVSYAKWEGLCACYLILSGVRPTEAVVILVRDPGPNSKRWCMDDSRCVLVQTNHDPETTVIDPQWAGDDPNLHSSIERQKVAGELLAQSINVSSCLAAMEEPPVYNKDTLFTSAMQPATGDLIYHQRSDVMPRGTLQIKTCGVAS